MAPNTRALIDFINICLMVMELVVLIVGLRKFQQVAMVGSWFRWKAARYACILLLDMGSLYFLYQGNPLYVALRLTLNQLCILWETTYCYHWQWWRLDEMWRYIFTHMARIDTAIKGGYRLHQHDIDNIS